MIGPGAGLFGLTRTNSYTGKSRAVDVKWNGGANDHLTTRYDMIDDEWVKGQTELHLTGCACIGLERMHFVLPSSPLKSTTRKEYQPWSVLSVCPSVYLHLILPRPQESPTTRDQCPMPWFAAASRPAITYMHSILCYLYLLLSFVGLQLGPWENIRSVQTWYSEGAKGEGPEGILSLGVGFRGGGDLVGA